MLMKNRGANEEPFLPCRPRGTNEQPAAAGPVAIIFTTAVQGEEHREILRRRLILRMKLHVDDAREPRVGELVRPDNELGAVEGKLANSSGKTSHLVGRQRVAFAQGGQDFVPLLRFASRPEIRGDEPVEFRLLVGAEAGLGLTSRGPRRPAFRLRPLLDEFHGRLGNLV